VYLKPTREECFAEYRKGIIDLTIDDSARKQAEIQAKDKRIAELEARDEKIKELENKFENLYCIIQAFPDLAKKFADAKLGN
jgi:hypothetical protein